MTWTQPVCDARWNMRHPDKPIPADREPTTSANAVDQCCYCGGPARIYDRIDPATVPHPRAP